MSAPPVEWHEFFVAVAGAAAALVGLIIVAMSVTIGRIIASRTMPSRAGATIGAMTLILLVALLALIPGQSALWFGVEIVAASIVTLCFVAIMTARMFTDPDWQRPVSNLLRSAVIAVPVLLVFAGGVALLFGADSGVALLAAGTVAVFAGAMLNVWVLLVEIQR